MGEHFFDRRPLVPLPTISSENTRVEDELVYIVDHLLGGVGHGAAVGVRYCVINMPQDNLDGVGGTVCLAEALVVSKSVGVGDDSVGLLEVVEQIQHAGSTISSVRPVIYPHKVVLAGA